MGRKATRNFQAVVTVILQLRRHALLLPVIVDPDAPSNAPGSASYSTRRLYQAGNSAFANIILRINLSCRSPSFCLSAGKG